MTDIVDIRVSPSVQGAHVFRVPCSFSPTHIPLLRKVAQRFTDVFNSALFSGKPEVKPFRIIGVPNLGMGLANREDEVLAWRRKGKWYLPQGWHTDSRLWMNIVLFVRNSLPEWVEGIIQDSHRSNGSFNVVGS